MRVATTGDDGPFFDATESGCRFPSACNVDIAVAVLCGIDGMPSLRRDSRGVSGNIDGHSLAAQHVTHRTCDLQDRLTGIDPVTGLDVSLGFTIEVFEHCGGRVEAGDNGDDGVPPVDWQQFDASSPAGSGAYAGPAPVHDAASRASDSVVSQCVDDSQVVYSATTGTF